MTCKASAYVIAYSSMTSTSAAFKKSPLAKLATATTINCAPQAKIYGQCVLASYNNARKDMCAAEFAQFKACLQSAVGPFSCSFSPKYDIIYIYLILMFIQPVVETEMVKERKKKKPSMAYAVSKLPGTGVAGSLSACSGDAFASVVAGGLRGKNKVGRRSLRGILPADKARVVLGKGRSFDERGITGGGSRMRRIVGRSRKCNTSG